VSVYTPPALNAVDFALSAFTPADVTPYGIALSTYTPPALNAVDFALSAYTPPTFPYVGWELLPSNNITGTASFGQGAGTFDAVATAISNITATADFGQGAGTFDAVGTTGTPPGPVIVRRGDGGWGGYDAEESLTKLEEARERKRAKRLAAMLLLMDAY
jgi:hypothetical protein